MSSEPIERALARIVGAPHVLTDPDTRAGFEVDWTGEYRGRSSAVIRPGTTAEVKATIDVCAARGVAVFPQGGNTGLVGGSVPDGSGDGIVLSTRRLTRLSRVDELSGQVTAGAGVSLARLQAHTRASGLDLGIDLAARDSATIGGMVATNAGGIHVLRHGTTRRHVIGVEAVLGTGDVVSHLGGLEKDNTGYDLAGLLCGSEGTLGIITAVRLRLVAVMSHRVTALLAWDGLEPMIEGLAELRRVIPTIEAAEYMVQAGVEEVLRRHHLGRPFANTYPAYLLVEMAAMHDPGSELADAVGALPGVLDEAVATEATGRARLWALRELHTETLASIGPPRKYDVAVPISSIPAFLDQATALVAELAGPMATCHHFGHLGDGNIHLNVVGVKDMGPTAVDRLDAALMALVVSHSGTISAEHGIGRMKTRWLPLVRSPAEIQAFRAIKYALDPSGILNPGVLFPGSTPSR